MTQTLDITTNIDGLLHAIDGDVSTRSRVIDGLLDLRNAAGARDDLVAHIDALLATAPGLSMVPNEWWRDALVTLRSMVGIPLVGR